jgi:hypothetical protein
LLERVELFLEAKIGKKITGLIISDSLILGTKKWLLIP